MRVALGFLVFASSLTASGCAGGDVVLPLGEPVELEVVDGSGQIAEPGSELSPLIVRLVDASGDGVPNATVTWAVTSGGGTVAPVVNTGGVLTPGSNTTDEEGFASARWTLGPTPGPNTVDAKVEGVGVATFGATAQSSDDNPGGGEGGGGDDGGGDDGGSGGGGDSGGGGGGGTGGGGTGGGGGGSGGGGTGGGGGSGAVIPSASLSTVTAAPAAIVAGKTATITVTVRDQSGERVQGATVSLVATGSGTTITQPAGPTNVDGIATGTLRATEPGFKEVRAIVNGAVEIDQVVRVRVSGPVHHLEFRVQPHDVREGEMFTVEVALVDVNGNIVPLSGIEIYVDLFRAGRDHPDNQRALGDRFRDTEAGVATFYLGVINGSSGDPVGRSESGYRFRALTDELPELGPHGPEPWLFSNPFDVSG